MRSLPNRAARKLRAKGTIMHIMHLLLHSFHHFPAGQQTQ